MSKLNSNYIHTKLTFTTLSICTQTFTRIEGAYFTKIDHGYFVYITPHTAQKGNLERKSTKTRNKWGTLTGRPCNRKISDLDLKRSM